MIQTLIIQGMPPNLNKYRNMHFFQLDKEKKKWDQITWLHVHSQGIQPIVGKVRMTYAFYFATRARHDSDNYACCAKFINDSLVDHGILTDDSFEFIEELRIIQGGFAKPAYIEITMEQKEKPSA